MSPAKVAVAVTAIALSLSACGVAAKPEAGSAAANTKSAAQKKSSDIRVKHVRCLAKDHIPYSEYDTDTPTGTLPSIQVGTRPTGPTIVFRATPGAAQNVQITGRAQGAEVIGSALVYPLDATNHLMAKVEHCMQIGVTG